MLWNWHWKKYNSNTFLNWSMITAELAVFKELNQSFSSVFQHYLLLFTVLIIKTKKLY